MPETTRMSDGGVYVQGSLKDVGMHSLSRRLYYIIYCFEPSLFGLIILESSSLPVSTSHHTSLRTPPSPLLPPAPILVQPCRFPRQPPHTPILAPPPPHPPAAPLPSILHKLHRREIVLALLHRRHPRHIVERHHPQSEIRVILHLRHLPQELRQRRRGDIVDRGDEVRGRQAVLV